MHKEELLQLLKTDYQLSKIEKYAKLLQQLTKLEEDNKTKMTGRHLNILDTVQDKIMNDEFLTDLDIQQIEGIIIEFL
jgi:hypothetical protein